MSSTKRRITVTVLGSGGCGGAMAHATAEYLSSRKQIMELYDFGLYLHDLSNDVYDYFPMGDEQHDRQLIAPIIIKPTHLDPGAGGVPIVAEIAFEHMPTTGDESSRENAVAQADNFSIIQRSSINIYLSSLGGGTGGRTCSLLIPELKKKAGGITDLAICVLTDKADEDLNHIYTFPKINRAADFVVIVQNGTIVGNQMPRMADEQFMNERIAEIVDILISVRQSGTLPRKFDFNNLVNHLATSKNYKDKCARWLVPFVYPVEGYDTSNYKDPQTTLLRLITDETLIKSSCLCDIQEEDIKKCEACVLIIRAPNQYIQDFRSKVHTLKEGQKKSAQAALLSGLATHLGLKGEGNIFYAYVPHETGLKICLLLLNMPIKKLRDLMGTAENDKASFEGDERKWRSGVERGVEDMRQLIEGHSSNHDGIKSDNLAKVCAKILTEDFKTLYRDILKHC